MASASLLTLPEVIPATEMRPSLVAYTECYKSVSKIRHTAAPQTRKKKKKSHLLRQHVHLLGLEAGVGKHADLAGDVGPVARAAEGLEVLLEQGAHADDAVGHALDLGQPLLVEGRVVEDCGGDARAVDRRVAVQRPHQDLQLRVHPLLLLRRRRHDREGAHALAVQALLSGGLAWSWRGWV